ncbi:MAG: ATP-binding protein, partial [Thermodesulfobium sp.]
MPVVYANIIDVIGKKLYTGDIVWIREYIQNAIDAAATDISINVEERDIIIKDNGKGMGLDEIERQLFSVGGSTKSPAQIGQFGIGMYAGSGICENILVKTKKEKNTTYIVELDLKKYNEEIRVNPSALFETVINKIFSLNRSDQKENEDHFTEIRFKNVNPDIISLFVKESGKHVREIISNSIPVPISEKFIFKERIEKFIKTDYKVNVTLRINGADPLRIMRFEDLSRKFVDDIILVDIKGDDQKTIAKMWAIYPADGKTLREIGSIRVKYKGLAVGGNENVIVNRFHSKDSKRFSGEIVVKDFSLQLNTERSWFVESKNLDEFVKATKIELDKLYAIANFDSRYANGLLRKSLKLEEISKKYNEENNLGNAANAKRLENEARSIKEKIISTAKELDNKVTMLGKTASNGDQYSKMKMLLAKETKEVLDLEKLNIAHFDQRNYIPPNRVEWNSGKYIRTLLEN